MFYQIWVSKIKVPGTHFQDQKYRNDNNRTIMDETEYSTNKQTEFE
jgi:hypothetical protein